MEAEEEGDNETDPRPIVPAFDGLKDAEGLPLTRIPSFTLIR